MESSNSQMDDELKVGAPSVIYKDFSPPLVDVMLNNNLWKVWPSTDPAEIFLLPDYACFNRSRGLVKKDGRWKDSVTLAVEKGRITLPNTTRVRKEILKNIDDVAFRCYHAARMVQNYFDNPTHDNFKDPLLETIYIMLTWRSKTANAKKVLFELIDKFEGPEALIKTESLPLLKTIIGKVGFTEKRPDMLINLVRIFMDKFPCGNSSVMNSWSDEDILNFLTGIPGIGRKSALCVMMYSLGRDRFPIDAHVGRVLKRTGLLRELVEIADKNDHKNIQLKAEFAVPPSVRSALHAGLVSLGKSTCRSGNPSCNKCPLNNICPYYAEKMRKKCEMDPFTHVDLFCGAGGFSTGLKKEGFRTILAVDIEPLACETFRLNHPELPNGNVQSQDLSRSRVSTIIKKCGGWREELKPGKIDVLTAGIPCQGFSKAGYRSRPNIKYDPLEDPRNHLYKCVLLWVRELKPRYVVLENVPEIRSAGDKDDRILDAICTDLEKIGYRVDYGIVNAFEHETPQIRYRMILIASHPSVPDIRIKELESNSKKGSTLAQSLFDLPSMNSDEGAMYQKLGKHVLTSHVSRFNNQEDLKIFEAIRPGEHYGDFIIRRKDIMDDRRKSGKFAIYGTKSFSDKYHKLEPDAPSRTIVAHLNKDGNGYIHPSQPRSITPREAMRLQGFDDSYIFCGSIGKQFVQVGNAVPPPLARSIGRLLGSHLRTVTG